MHKNISNYKFFFGKTYIIFVFIHFLYTHIFLYEIIIVTEFLYHIIFLIIRLYSSICLKIMPVTTGRLMTVIYILMEKRLLTI